MVCKINIINDKMLIMEVIGMGVLFAYLWFAWAGIVSAAFIGWVVSDND